LQPLKSQASIKRPDNLWNYSQQRDKLKFLINQPVCTCGAGKDISFLFDVQNARPKTADVSKNDASSIRAPEDIFDNPLQLTDTLVPDEYHIVKSRGVWPLRINENQFTTMPEDHLNHVTIFPSMKPAGRNEVIQLKHTMDALLEKVGANTIEQKGPTQLHNLLEIIKQEQDIYNIIFNEVIRQVTVECKDRGEILAKIRERYANLLAIVPKQIKSLHDEVIAQRALDRRLTEELMHFKSTIAYLTQELSEVREHDRKISDESQHSQKDLENALAEAQKNSSLLSEYHELYELQRKRLEKHVENLIEERELWTTAAYSIAMKVAEENKLNSSKRLNLAEKSWYKLARHFTIFLSDKDTKIGSSIQVLVANWRNLINGYRTNLEIKEEETRKHFLRIQAGLQNIKNYLSTNSFDNEGILVNPPDLRKTENILSEIKNWQEFLNKENDKLNGDEILIDEETLKKANFIVKEWSELVQKIFQRHALNSQRHYMNFFDTFQNLHKRMLELQGQYNLRSHGDNGIASAVTHLTNMLEIWSQKLTSYVNVRDAEQISNAVTAKPIEIDWISYYQSIDDCLDVIKRGLNKIGLVIRDVREDSASTKNDEKIIEIDHDDVLNQTNAWLSNFSHQVESQDASIIEQVNSMHTKMIHWMIQVLLRLAPDKNLTEEAVQLTNMMNVSLSRVIETSQELIEAIDEITNRLTGSCDSIVSEDVVEKQNLHKKYPEKEAQQLKELKTECDEWILASKILLSEITNDKSFISNIGKSTRKASEELPIETIEEESENNTEKSETEIDTKVPEESNTIVPEKEEYPHKESLEDNKEKMYEVLADDKNTTKKVLDGITLNGSGDEKISIVKDEQNAAYNTFKTIENLQEQLINTEERAQMYETKASKLELELKDALEKLRLFEKSSEEISNLSQIIDEQVNNEDSAHVQRESTASELSDKSSKTAKQHTAHASKNVLSQSSKKAKK